MQLRQPKGEAYPTRYHGMIIGRLLDSFLPEQSDQAKFFDHGDESYTVLKDSKTFYAGIAMSTATIGGAHLWRERRLNSLNIFLSDTLQTKISEAGLRLPPHYKLKTV